MRLINKTLTDMQPSERFFDITDDFRNPFARDRDRIIHSGSFRRLEYKTQVFINQEGDFFRTRLTHSLEVSQIARSIANELELNEALAEAIALAHDLGHTPFGHVGGDALDTVLKEAGYRNGFEHNFQSFRVVTKLEQRYKQFLGLNLTFASLEGLIKHSFPYKKGFLPQVIDETFNLSTHPSIEAMVVDHADEIAYLSHDIDDGVHAGLISFDELRQNAIVAEVLKKVEAEGVSLENEEMFRYRFTSHFINTLVYALLDFSKGNLSPTLQCATLDASQPLPIGYERTLNREIKALKRLMFDKLYYHHFIKRKMHAGKQAVKGLFHAFHDDVRLMPKYYAKQCELRNTHRVVADYIASLSDRYALSLYRELYGYA